MTTRPGQLLNFARRSEDVAAGLFAFRQNVPDSDEASISLTGAVSDLHAISTLCRQVEATPQTVRSYDAAVLRVKADIDLTLDSFTLTLENIFSMFRVPRGHIPAQVWLTTLDHFEFDERCTLRQRLVWYTDFLRAQLRILEGGAQPASDTIRAHIENLLRRQRLQHRRHSIGARPTYGVRPPIPQYQSEQSRRYSYRQRSPSPDTVISDDLTTFAYMPNRPEAPEVPSPISPTYTSSSSRTLDSSHTSYSNYAVFGGQAGPSSSRVIGDPTPTPHWAQGVWDGRTALTEYYQNYRRVEDAQCFGEARSDTIQSISDDGFLKVVELEFQTAVVVRLYYRRRDNRARISMSTIQRDRLLHYSCLLVNLRAVRVQANIIELKRLRQDGHFDAWARLPFIHHERMVQFYNTFVCLKRQDGQRIYQPLLESGALQAKDHAQPPRWGEKELFRGAILHVTTTQGMRHQIRILEDVASGVLRLEAAALNGSMQDVPIWTAFLNRHVGERGWLMLVRNTNTLRLRSLQPAPIMFIDEYTPPRSRDGCFELPFMEQADMERFCTVWTAIGRKR